MLGAPSLGVRVVGRRQVLRCPFCGYLCFDHESMEEHLYQHHFLQMNAILLIAFAVAKVVADEKQGKAGLDRAIALCDLVSKILK